MQCSNCGAPMTRSKTGWLCLNCGHTEAGDTAASSAAEPSQPPAPGTPPTVATPAVAAPTVPASAVMPGLPPVPPSGGRRQRILTIVGVVVSVLIIVGGLGFKLFWLDPRNAPVAYFQKLAAAKTGHLQATFDVKNANSNALLGFGEITAGAAADYDVSSQSAAKFDATLGLRATGSNGNAITTPITKSRGNSIAVHIIGVPKTTYLQLTKAGLLTAFGLKSSQTWYSVPAQPAQQNHGSSQQCSNSKGGKSSSWFGLNLPTQIPVTNAHRVGWSATIAGHSTTHYNGTIDFNKLQTVVDDANKQLAAACKISFNKNDYRSDSVTYNLWTSKQFDRLSLNIQDPAMDNGTLTIDSSNYNQPVAIKPPSSSKPLGSLK